MSTITSTAVRNCSHVRSCSACDRLAPVPCGAHVVGTVGHERCRGAEVAPVAGDGHLPGDTADGQPSVGAEYHAGVSYDKGRFTLRDVFEARGHISRVRMLREAGRVDISYIHATIPVGEGRSITVPVDLSYCPSTYLIPVFKIKSTFIEWGKAEGVYAKGLGLLDEANYSTL